MFVTACCVWFWYFWMLGGVVLALVFVVCVGICGVEMGLDLDQGC